MSAAPMIQATPVTAMVPTTYTREQLDLLKRTIANNLDDDEFALFVQVFKRLELDPFRKQIYAVKRKQKDGSYRVAFQTGIDGFRIVASRSGEYEGQVGPFWCGKDGQWTDHWIQPGAPVAAKVGVWRKGFREPVWGFARFASYSSDQLWNKMPEVMIAKCAEALAIRKAFPENLSGVYTSEEMQQADEAPQAPAAMGPGAPAKPSREEDLEAFAKEVRLKLAGILVNGTLDDFLKLRGEVVRKVPTGHPVRLELSSDFEKGRQMLESELQKETTR